MSTRSLLDFEDQASLVEAVVEGLLALPVGAHVALTGGRAGSQVSARFVERRSDPVTIWFSDERFVELDSPDRNDADVRSRGSVIIERALGPVDRSDDGSASGYSVEESARDYEQRLFSARPDGAVDIAVLSIGPDGHVASIFPGHPLLDAHVAAVLPIVDSPKPPPQRITWTLPLINRATSVWLLAAGADKAEVVHAVQMEDRSLPATHAVGEVSTRIYTCR